MAQNQKNVTKADMISEIASRTGLNKADVKTVIETSKKARNISKGTTIEIPAHETPAYKPSKEFADSIRNQ